MLMTVSRFQDFIFNFLQTFMKASDTENYSSFSIKKKKKLSDFFENIAFWVLDPDLKFNFRSIRLLLNDYYY